MQIDLGKAKELFLAVLEMPAPERAAYLESACAGDTALRQRIDAMLRTHENSGELLPCPPVEMLANATEAEATGAFHEQMGPESVPFLTQSDKPGCLGRLGHYEVKEVIGKGGFGIVLKGFDEKLHRVVAIKVLSPAYAAIGSARKRFIREAQSAAAVKNEHVVAIYSVKDEAQPPYLVMELIDGISLQDKLDKKGSLSLKEILRIGMQTAEGLAAAHKQGLVHRDIKPANILLENGVERVRITDFGLARAVDDASMTQSGTVTGTPMYMSPEQAEGLPIDHRSDLFSLGTVLYAMCTGHPPFRASGTHAVLKRVIDAAPRPICEINNEVPDWLCNIISKLHAKMPGERFQTAKEVAELLGQHLAHIQQPSQAPLPLPTAVPTSLVPGSDEPAKAQPMIAPGLALILWPTLIGLILGAVVGGVLKWSNPPWLSELWGIDTSHWLAVACSAGLGAWLGVLVGLTRWVVARRISWELNKAPKNEAASPAATASLPAAPRRGIRLAEIVLVIAAVVMVPCVISVGIVVYLFSSSSSPQSNVGDSRQKDHNLFLVRDDPAISLFANPEQGGQNGFVFDGLEFGTALPPGRYQVQGKKNDVLIFQQWVTLDANLRTTVHVHSGWVQLFNGKDLTGWKAHPEQPGIWNVEEGELVGSTGGGPISHLYTTRGDFTNFHLRAEVKINRDRDSGIHFHCTPYPEFDLKPSGGRGKQPLGYEANIAKSTPTTGGIGSIWRLDAQGKVFHRLGRDVPIEANTWFVLEIVMNGNHIVTKVNGKVVDDFRDKGGPANGHFALEAMYAPTRVHFKKIEIKELPPEDFGWRPLFNGKDLTGWTNPSRALGPWKVEQGILIGKGDQAFLRTERGPFSDFHLRMEAKYLGNSGGLVLRENSPDVAGAGYECSMEDGNTGALTILFTKALLGSMAFPTQALTRRDQWFTLEVIASGNRLQTFVDGKKAVDFVDIHNEFKKGFIGLNVRGKDGELYVKKIEIKELPPEERGWIHIFNGTDLNGWNSAQRNKWKVENGALVGVARGTLTSNQQYGDFHCRIKTKFNAESMGSVVFGGKADFHAEARIGDKSEAKTGSLLLFAKPKAETIIPWDKQLIPPDTWFELEIMVRGQNATVKVNGTTTAEKHLETLPKGLYPISLQANEPGTIITVSKIEIKELSTEK